MAHDNHHFVPQFYLRRFSADPVPPKDARSISLLLDSGTIVKTASIAGQCQRKHLYGSSPVLEEAFASREGGWSALLRELEHTLAAPAIFGDSHQELLQFISIQRGRTLASGHDHRLAMEVMEDRFLTTATDKTANLSDDSYHVLEALSMHLSAWGLLLDLEISYISNTTNDGFITSDNPILFYNYVVQKPPFGGSVAYASPGLVIFAPVSPTLVIMLFDRNFYGISTKKRAVIIPSASDVFELNVLLCANSQEVVYFNRIRTSEAHLRQIQSIGLPLRVRHRILAQDFVKNDGDQITRALAIGVECIDRKIHLSFLHQFTGRRERLLAAMARQVVPRHPELMAIFERSRDNDSILAVFSHYLKAENKELSRRIAAGARPYIGAAANSFFPRMSREFLSVFS